MQEYDVHLMSVRGIIATHDGHVRPFALTSLKKWIRLNVAAFKAEKIDVRGERDGLALLPELLEFATLNSVRLSLRTAEPVPPANLSELAKAGLFDVFLCPARVHAMDWEAWFTACAALALPVRVQITPPFPIDLDPESLAERLKGALAVNVALDDPFTSAPPCRNASESKRVLAQMNALARALNARGLETHLIGLPFCLVDAQNRRLAANRQQFFTDYQHYGFLSYDFARRIHRRGPARLDKAVESLLARRTSVHNLLDNRLFPLLIDHPSSFARTWLLHKILRHFQFLRCPRPEPENLEACEALVAELRKKEQTTLGPTCAACRFQRICDHASETFRRHLPGLDLVAQAGDTILSRSALGDIDRPRRYDAIDSVRRALPERCSKLAEEARNRILRQPPTREISTDDYNIEKHYTHHMPGAVRWLSMVNVEHESTVLTRIEPPFTMTLTFGGGIAGHIGFSFGRHAKIVCPMIDYSHRLTLHVDRDGYYVLLRDGVLVRPTQFEHERRIPNRLAGCLEPRISIHNIDGQIITQTLLLWEGDAPKPERRECVKYSVVIISTRYTRRLQAALLALANQRGIDPGLLEVVVGYVPGIDATDDLIDSMRYAYPHLRIVRSPFSEDYVRAKGFMINECRTVASGEWVVLLDADIILPPDFFAEVEKVEAGAHFIAPDGRKLLSPETTGRILLGQIRPWEDFTALAESEPEFRYREADRVPIGFCQCVRREVIENIPYHELDHFEASDWHFGHEVVTKYGKEKRLEGRVVLHLDHGGSQWYGTTKHM